MASSPEEGTAAIPLERGARSASPAWVLFDVARRRFALPASVVARVAPMPRIVAVPFASPMLKGAANISGDVIAVLDAAKWLGLADETSPGALMVLQDPLGLVGILVDRVRRVTRLPQVARPSQDPASARRTIEDDREGEITLLHLAELPRPESLHRAPAPTSRVSLAGSLRSVPQLAGAGATDRRRLLAFTSAEQSHALPVGAVARIRDRREAKGERPFRDGHGPISLATLLGAPSGREEHVVIDVAVADRSVSLAVESIIGLRREDDRFSEAATAAFLRRLLGD